jgi:hypothetical protein
MSSKPFNTFQRLVAGRQKLAGRPRAALALSLELTKF